MKRKASHLGEAEKKTKIPKNANVDLTSRPELTALLGESTMEKLSDHEITSLMTTRHTCCPQHETLTVAREGEWKDDFLFVCMADPQFGMYTYNKGLEEEVKIMRIAVAKINQLQPRFVIVCGDMINASPSDIKDPTELQRIRQRQIKAFNECASEISADIPLVCLCGNHDVGNVATRATLETYKADFGPDYFSFWVGGVKSFVLNTSLFHSPQGAPDLAVEQWKWLCAEIKQTPSQNPTHTLAFGHIPPFLGSRDEPEGYFNWRLSTRNMVLDRFKSINTRIWFSGHYHANCGGYDDEMEVVVTSAVGVNLSPYLERDDPYGVSDITLTDPPIGPSVSGMRLVKVSRNKISHKWFSLNEIPSTVDMSSHWPASTYTKHSSLTSSGEKAEAAGDAKSD